MQDLIVVGFHGIHRASEVLSQIQQLEYDWRIDLDDAVTAYRTESGRLRIDQSVLPTTKQGAGLGVFIGAMLGSLLAAPFTAGLSTAAAAAAVGAGAVTAGTLGGAIGAVEAEFDKEAYGISEEFVERVGGMIQPGDSAVFALVRTADPEVVVEHFRGYGGTILRTRLSPEAAARVQAVLRADTK
jgi:uncharacterized membrane protein